MRLKDNSHTLFGRHVSGNTLRKRLRLFRKCVSPPDIKQRRGVMYQLEKWELCVHQLQPYYEEQNLSPGLQAGVLVQMVLPCMIEYPRTNVDDSMSPRSMPRRSFVLWRPGPITAEPCCTSAD